jgi:hypothetical protein
MPSEVIEAMNTREIGRFKKKSDIHVAGMIAVFILTKGEHPFGNSLHDCMANIFNWNPVNLANLEDLEAKQFVSWLIHHNIDDRPYAREALSYPFLDQVEIYKGLHKPIVSLVVDEHDQHDMVVD